jgi:hypothetical protein
MSLPAMQRAQIRLVVLAGCSDRDQYPQIWSALHSAGREGDADEWVPLASSDRYRLKSYNRSPVILLLNPMPLDVIPADWKNTGKAEFERRSNEIGGASRARIIRAFWAFVANCDSVAGDPGIRSGIHCRSQLSLDWQNSFTPVN